MNRLSKSMSFMMVLHKCNFLLQFLLKIKANFPNFTATKICPIDNSANKSIINHCVTDLFGNPKGPVELGNPNTCAETKLCLNFILFPLKK